jgi:hypothetical protein
MMPGKVIRDTNDARKKVVRDTEVARAESQSYRCGQYR